MFSSNAAALVPTRDRSTTFLAVSAASYRTALQISQCQRADRHANQAQYLDSQRFEHAPDLAIFPFVEHDLDPGILLARREAMKRVWRRGFPRDLRRRFSTPRAAVSSATGRDLYVVNLVEVRFRRGDARSPLRIVRHQQKSFARFVESARPVRSSERRDPLDSSSGRES